MYAEQKMTKGEGAMGRNHSKSNEDWRQFVEWQLRNYPFHKQFLESYQKNGDEIGLPSSLGNVGGIKSGVIASPTENQALYLLDLQDKAKTIAWYIQAIEDILFNLNDTDRILIEQRYFSFDTVSIQSIVSRLFISTAAYYRRSNILLKKFACRFGVLPYDIN